ncbi:36442_t:CDS:2, partial [Gigaspora margarita]
MSNNWYQKLVQQKPWARVSFQRDNKSWVVRKIDTTLEVLDLYSILTPIDLKTIKKNLILMQDIIHISRIKIYNFDNDSTFQNLQEDGSDYTAYKSLMHKSNSERKSFLCIMGFLNHNNVFFLQYTVTQYYPNLFNLYNQTIKAFQKEARLENTMKCLQQKITDLSNNDEKFDSEANSDKLIEVIEENINKAKLGSTILVDSKQYLQLVFSQPCINSVLAAVLVGGIIYHSLQSILLCIGITSQSCRKNYFLYQTPLFSYLVTNAKESTLFWLEKALDFMKQKNVNYLPVSFDCSWSHGRNARQASGELIFQEFIPGISHKPLIAFHTVEKARSMKNQDTEKINNFYEENFEKSSRQIEHCILIAVLNEVELYLDKYDFVFEIVVDGDLDTNRTLANMQIVSQIYADLKHISKNVRKSLFCWMKDNSELCVQDPILKHFLQVQINEFRHMLGKIFRLPVGQGLVTTYRTSINEAFNRVKLVYLDKKIDFWKSFSGRHALAIIYHNDSYAKVLKTIRFRYTSESFTIQDK